MVYSTCRIQDCLPILKLLAYLKESICIDIQEQHEKMPIGDQLASVITALANDNLMIREKYTLSRER